jgi:hypothetical protein
MLNQDFKEFIQFLNDNYVQLVKQIASLILSIATKQKIGVSEYTDWQSTQWQDFVLTQFFGEDDEIEYSLEDAEEIYQPSNQMIL